MHKTILAALLALGVIATASIADDIPAQRHTVMKGDTLWDLAGKYYRDPWGWPSIWEANKTLVNDPNLIVPAQVLVIPEKTLTEKPAAAPVLTAANNEGTKAEAVTALETKIVEEPAGEEQPETAVPEPEPAVEPAPEAAAPAPEEKKGTEPAPAVKKYFDAEGMTVPKDWKGDGYIVGDKDKKTLISQGDTVYLDLGKSEVRPGTRLMIYRKVGKVRDHDTGDFLGYEVRRIGRLEVTNSIEKNSSTAKVITSYEPVELGDAVKIINAE